MADSLQLMTSRQKLQWNIEKIEREGFEKTLLKAKELAAANRDLQEILFWIESLSKVGCSSTSIINAWATIKSSRAAKEDDEATHG